MVDKSRFQQWRNTRKQINKTSKERINEFSRSGRNSRYVLKKARGDYKEAKQRVRRTRKNIKQTLATDKTVQERKQALTIAKQHLDQAKRQGNVAALELAKSNYETAKARYTEVVKTVREELAPNLSQAKQEKKIAKKTVKQATKQTGGSRPRKIVRLGLHAAHRQASHTTNDVLSQDDEALGLVAETRQRFTRANITVHQTKQAGHILGSGGKFVIKRSYNIGNRFYNLKKGKGFTVTPKEFSWYGRLGDNYRNWKQQLKQNKAVKTYRVFKRVGGWAVKPVVTVAKNPLTVKSYIWLFILALIVALFSAGSGVAIQDEYELNKTWLYLTQKDREKSNDKVDYWTNWEDSLLYINHHYDDISDRLKLNPSQLMIEQFQGKFYLNTLWDNLNKDEKNLKTMKDLYSQSGSIFHLDKEDLEAYEELLEETKELGTFSALIELDNPFYLPETQEAERPLRITERFGYTDKTTINTKTSLAATPGQTLYATMAGVVEVNGKDVTISDKEAKFTYYNVSTLQVKTGDQIKSGTIIGIVSESAQVIGYQKYLIPPTGEKDNNGQIKPQWTAVNPGFYFQKVEYTQATSVISAIDVSGDKALRARRFYQIIKQREPKATLEGVAAALGGYDIESGITFKRYETDYLTNNQFDKVAKQPTAENLVGSWSAFQALYPNLSLYQLGYVVNGLHYIGVGIGQWTGGRSFALWEFARTHSLDIWSEEAQIRFLLEGDSPFYQEVFRKTVTGTGTTDDLTEYFLNNWLGVPGNKLKERQYAAKQWHQLLKGGASGTTGVASQTVPAGYKDKLPYGLPSDRSVLEGQGYPGNAYELGNCTWYVYNRMTEIGKPIYAYLGDASSWVESSRARGYTITTTPRVGSAAVFLNNVAGAHPHWGHVGVVEYVNSDGTFLMSEMNFTGLYRMTWRTLSPQAGIYFVTPN
ncbi:phage tail tip lysozyme [Streptococcus sp. S784/96/1]|uniref:phage tail tip lysozyme n=1 Tax=Streptococcus sp. S784/96/1 TaxID=2653499 RepID=UPI001387604E|nr:phage tail tip lysozyme [Streptococcus sp. S784/96/1]